MKFAITTAGWQQDYSEYKKVLEAYDFRECRDEFLGSNFVPDFIIDVNSLEDLMNLSASVGHDLVIHPYNDCSIEGRITIYDDYLE